MPTKRAQWNDVAKVLPKRANDVIVIFSNSEIAMAYYHQEGGLDKAREWRDAMTGRSCTDEGYTVAYWMSLPPIPPSLRAAREKKRREERR